MIKNGTKIRNPQAAASPTPTAMLSIVASMVRPPVEQDPLSIRPEAAGYSLRPPAA
jgi:hypothetical protein